MIKIDKTEVTGWDSAIRGMRNPRNSWDRSDTLFIHEGDYYTLGGDSGTYYGNNDDVEVGPNDLDLMLRLAGASPVEGKFRRMIVVYVDITAPLYWWKEFDTYKVGTVANSCSSIHKIRTEDFTEEDFSCEHMYQETLDLFKQNIDHLNKLRDVYLNGGFIRIGQFSAHFDPKNKEIWYNMIQLLPSSYNQKRTVMLNYEVLANIYRHRRSHKLDEWRTLCGWIKRLPYSEIITCGVDKEEA